MPVRRLIAALGVLGAALTVGLGARPAYGQCGDGGCGVVSGGAACCQRWHCPPHFVHCTEGPPRICFRRACPLPVCCPTDAPNWGYFPNCWRPWMWPTDWSHCPVPPPGALSMVPGHLYNAPPTIETDVVPQPTGQPLPPPRKIEGPNGL
jgi:hypothetical protein